MTKALIIGGGHAGLLAATNLRKRNKSVEIVLVEPKEFFELVMFAFRSPFDEETATGSLIDLSTFCEKQKVTHIKTTVTRLNDKMAILANGIQVEFDVCLVATGAGYAWKGAGRGPTASASIEHRRTLLKEEGEKLVEAKSVLIVGGGLIGAELAGELAFYKKEKGRDDCGTVTLVHSGDHLCPEMSLSAGKMVQNKLEGLGVTVILNDKASRAGNGKMVLGSSGEFLEADEIIMTVGVSPVNSFLEEKYLSSEGWVNVDECCLIKGSNGRLFAFGDCCTRLPKSASQLSGTNASNIAYNLAVVLDTVEKGPETVSSKKLKTITTSSFMCIATVGPGDGVFYTNCFYTQYLIPSLKKISLIENQKSDFGF